MLNKTSQNPLGYSKNPENSKLLNLIDYSITSFCSNLGFNKGFFSKFLPYTETQFPKYINPNEDSHNLKITDLETIINNLDTFHSKLILDYLCQLKGFVCVPESNESDNKFSVYKRTNKLNAFFNSLKNLKYSDVKVMFDFFYFIRKNRKYSFFKALNRTISILLRPLQYRENIKNSIIIVDDGPIGKLSTNGISDKNWLDLLGLARPSKDEYNTVYIFLTLDEKEHQRRLELRGEKTDIFDNDSSKVENSTKVSRSKRVEGYAFWKNELENTSSKCLSYKLEEYEVEELANQIYKEVTKKNEERN